MTEPYEPGEPTYDNGGAGVPDKDTRTWAMVAHLSALIGLVVTFPFANVIAPLIVWQVKKELPFVDDQGREAVNFQITVALMGMVAWILLCAGIGFILIPLVFVYGVVFAIIAGLKANNGEAYRYPLTIRLIQ
jgi:uncharacterized Tic20 family protein